jgi:two-component system sensor histidine kinase YesM
MLVLWIVLILLAAVGAGLIFMYFLNGHQDGFVIILFGYFLIFTGLGCGLFAFIHLKIFSPLRKIGLALEIVLEKSDGGKNLDFDIPEDFELNEIGQNIEMLINKLKEYANREYAAQLLLKQSAIKALQTQINPHFLYNTLDSIRGLAVKEGQMKISQMTKALSGIFKYSISKTEELTTIREEIKNVENYMLIQQLRFDNRFVLVKDFEEIGSLLEATLPKMTIQPIVENAVYHGLEPKIGNGMVRIKIYMTQKRLVISVNDNGVGIIPERLNEIYNMLSSKEEKHINSVDKTSIALKNVNERIKLFYGERYGVSIYSTLGVGTTVDIVLPLIV